ncbi:MAG: hypothetical protein HC933_13600 [Pleurocapsa sp. SU_196_0]|nr:hypothetical protein [Pleurocapsa sp. SU_196_0]
MKNAEGSYETSEWRWDGDKSGAGYRWTKTPSLVDDATLGSAFPREVMARDNQLNVFATIANITDKAWTYKMRVDLVGPDGVAVKSETFEKTQKPYQWGYPESTVAHTFERVRAAQAGTYVIKLTLTQDGVVQDVKTVSFTVK